MVYPNLMQLYVYSISLIIGIQEYQNYSFYSLNFAGKILFSSIWRSFTVYWEPHRKLSILRLFALIFLMNLNLNNCTFVTFFIRLYNWIYCQEKHCILLLFSNEIRTCSSRVWWMTEGVTRVGLILWGFLKLLNWRGKCWFSLFSLCYKLNRFLHPLERGILRNKCGPSLIL